MKAKRPSCKSDDTRGFAAVVVQSAPIIFLQCNRCKEIFSQEAIHG